MNATDKYALMTEAPVERLVCRMAWPSMIIMLISALYNMADTYFVGFLGTSATAAIGIVFSLMAFIQAIGFLFGHGAGNFISRELGAQRMDRAAKMAATGFFSSFGICLVLTVFCIIYSEALAGVLGATETIMPYALEYMHYILLGAPFMASSFVLNQMLRYQGSSFYAMLGMTTGAVLNIGLDPLFIFVLDMGISGAAIATMISQIISCVLLFIVCMLRSSVPIRVKNFSTEAYYYVEILRGGLPALCRQGIASIATLSINHMAGLYGDAAIAAISIVQRVTMFAGSALVGFGQGFQPVCGFNYGAGKHDRVKKAFWFCVRLSTVVLTLLAVIGFVLAPLIVSVFRPDADVIRIGAAALRLQCLSFPFLGWIIISNMLLQNINRAVEASVLALSRQGLFLLPTLFLLVPVLGILGIQLSQPLADLAAFLLSVYLGRRVLRSF